MPALHVLCGLFLVVCMSGAGAHTTRIASAIGAASAAGAAVDASSSSGNGGCDTLGHFWHITDFHLDPWYRAGADPTTMCHTATAKTSPANTGATGAGVFGDYLCDSPLALVQSAISFMIDESRRVAQQLGCPTPKPDFIVWTGDDLPHVAQSEINANQVLFNIRNITRAIAEAFPGVQVFPVLGNHDYHPKGQFAPGASWLYEAIGAEWSGGSSAWLSASANRSFGDGGFYTMPLTATTTLLALNTVLYYTQNLLTVDLDDPAGQFAWFEAQLSAARASGQRVYVIHHVPPGYYERAVDNFWFYTKFNERFVGIIKQFSDVIIGHFSSHQHSDTFRLFMNSDQRVLSSMFLAPSVTPWQTTLPNVTANNPSVRLFYFNRTTDAPVDYTQYYLNLSAANALGVANWTTLYTATTAYALPSIAPTNLGALYASLVRDPNSALFDQYLEFNAVGYPTAAGLCDAVCRRNQYCSIAHISYPEHERCMNATNPPTPSPPPGDGTSTDRRTLAIVLGTVVPIVVLAVVITLCWRRRRQQQQQSSDLYNSMAASNA